jgi:diguanylate cyclase (GGDEF)-like protein
MTARRDVPGRHARWIVVLCSSLVWLGLMLGFAAYLTGSQANARYSTTARLQARVTAAAEFASLYIRDISNRERAQAAIWLSGPRPGHRSLVLAAGAVGSAAGVVLNSEGDVLQVLPADHDLLGVDLAPGYPDLTAGLAGRSTVSGVVTSEVRMISAVALTVPFRSPAGRRVFSVTFAVSETPLQAYMNHLLVVPNSHVYLIDSAQNLVAGSGTTVLSGNLAQSDRRLSASLRTNSTGTYGAPQGATVFVSARIADTPWRIVGSEPAAELYSSIDGTIRSLAWVALAGLALAGLVIITIGSRLARSRSRLAQLASQLDRLARVDPLTDLSNRRDLDEILDATLSAARRDGTPLSVLLVDIDHFKQINDSVGHDAGDSVLIQVAHAMRACLRAQDSLGRWGGEEFLAVLPNADAGHASFAADRLRSQILRATSIPDRAPVTVTIGVATYDSGTKSELVSRADAALYAGKRAGRNQVQVAPPSSPAGPGAAAPGAERVQAVR